MTGRIRVAPWRSRRHRPAVTGRRRPPAPTTALRLGVATASILALVAGALAVVVVPAAPAAADTATVECQDGGPPGGATGYEPTSECDNVVSSYEAQQCEVEHSDSPSGTTDTLTVTCPGAAPPPGPPPPPPADPPSALPVGSLDRCTAEGNGDAVCIGWARDPDSTGPIDVHLYLGGPMATPGIRRVTLTADLSSEPAVGGGGAHRFSVRIPDVTTSTEIHAYGIGLGADGAADSGDAELSNSPLVPTRTCGDAVFFPEHIAGHLADITEPSAREAFVTDPCAAVDDTDLSGPITEEAAIDPVFPGGFEIQDLGNDCARVIARYEITHRIAGAAPVEATVDACARFHSTDRPGQGPLGWVVTGPGGTGDPQVSIEVGTFPIPRGGAAWTIERGGLGSTGVLATRYVPYGEAGVVYDQGAWQAQLGFDVRFFLSAFFVGGGTVDREFEETAWLPEVTYSMLRS